MEHLTKQQIVLLTLLVSFVTSIATGIVTVSLVDQAPSGVTSTINHVIERTIEEVSPASADSNQASVIDSGILTTPRDQISDAVATVEKSIVIIKNQTGVDVNGQAVGSTTGIGMIVSSNGAIVTDKASIAMVGNYIGVFSGGKVFPLQITQSQNAGDLVILSPQIPIGTKPAPVFIPVTFASTLPLLGQRVISLSGGDSPAVNEGITTSISQSSSTLTTNIDTSKDATASIFFDESGAILGLESLALNLYPSAIIQAAIPK